MYPSSMTSAQLRRWLAGQGCVFAPGKGGHLKVRRGDLFSVLPMHGSDKELGKGLVEKIKEDLGLK
ncbi:MAG TPA: type II toxin-antitoxin system HicA family toxin [Bryobacteraceae bacterium]|nr:type II toxin-antitoxin system HicA family toxin [Bryobacteraceae bacterium]